MIQKVHATNWDEAYKAFAAEYGLRQHDWPADMPFTPLFRWDDARQLCELARNFRMPVMGIMTWNVTAPGKFVVDGASWNWNDQPARSRDDYADAACDAALSWLEGVKNWPGAKVNIWPVFVEKLVFDLKIPDEKSLTDHLMIRHGIVSE